MPNCIFTHPGCIRLQFVDLSAVTYFSTSHMGRCLEPVRRIYPFSLRESNAL
jgi:hypothetical protein